MADISMRLSLGGRSPTLTALKRVATSPRLYLYFSCTLLAILTSYHLGKEMLWDTMDYHVYAGFSALHDRFNQDYFAAGPQGYFNPYVYVPFYLLLRSALTPLEDASILAALQSAILWLTFELALVIAPREKPRVSLAVGTLAVAFAFANPVLINELGSSYADIITAEVVLAGWLMLLSAVRTPSAARVACAGLLLGAVSALKLTNVVHAVSATALLLFIPGGWRSKLRYAALSAAGVATGFVAVSAPWSLRLEQYFGNPLFPLLNGVFRSPEFTTARILDYRFIPTSLGAALLRPFAMVTSTPMVHFELPAPDLRYALLLTLAVLLLVQRVWWKLRARQHGAVSSESPQATRTLAALGCGFLLDWTLWLTASGNSRYFIPMACVAAVLVVTLVFRLLAGRPKARNYLLAAVLGLQCFALHAGTDYRARLPWTRGPWFSLSVPAELAAKPSLYFLVGIQSNSFIIPDLPAGSGFINLDGGYVLGPDGANGRRIEALIERYAPRMRVLVRDPRADPSRETSLPGLEPIDDALEPFGLKALAARCSTIVADGVTTPSGPTEYLVTCPVERIGPAGRLPLPGQHSADLALDHLEDACPALFQPARPVDTFTGDRTSGYLFARRYSNTGTMAWVAHGSVRFVNRIDGREEGVGSESMWATAPPRVSCRREGSGYLILPGRHGTVLGGSSTAMSDRVLYGVPRGYERAHLSLPIASEMTRARLQCQGLTRNSERIAS
ncbi:MAG TPA: glycosyltransferase family 87 protein [Steroidobacteraceae bacterium]|nr:glycosyltransferase family 87 protein [Steroidobacteraceae bacterium]